MEKKIGWALVGHGGMGSWHLKRAMVSDVIDVIGVYDIKPERNARAEEKGAHAFASFEELLADPRVELVTIATPNELHRPLAIQAMAAGKNVISEKPVTLCSADLEAMIAASKQYGVLFTVHQNRRWDEDFLMMRELYQTGKLGYVFDIESRVQGSRGIPGDWRGKKEHGGGMILDWGVHLIDQMLQIVNDQKIDSVYCRCSHLTNAEVDDGFALDIYFEKGTTARIEVGTAHFVSLPRYYMAGSSGAALIKDWHDDCHVTICTEWNEGEVTPINTAAGLTKTMAPRDAKTTEDYVIPRPKSDVHDFYRNVAKAIRGEEEQLIKHDELRRVMHVMETAFESDRQGKPVKFLFD